MLIVLLTCLLAAGEVYTPVSDWEIVKIVAGGHGPIPSLQSFKGHTCTIFGTRMICAGGGAPDDTKIELRRTVSSGEEVKPPIGCEVASIKVQ